MPGDLAAATGFFPQAGTLLHDGAIQTDRVEEALAAFAADIDGVGIEEGEQQMLLDACRGKE